MKDEVKQKLAPRSWQNGVFIVNEGAFNHSNSSLGWYDYESNEYQSELYKKANNQHLGDIFQSINFTKNELILVINNSDKIVTLNGDSLIQENIFVDVQSPRHQVMVDDSMLYVTSLKEKFITKWSCKSNHITKKIPFPRWSEWIVRHNDYLYVSSPSLYSGSPTNFVYIISLLNDQVIDSIKVLTSPSEMLFDKNDRLWIYCQGHFLSKNNGGIVQVDLDTRQMIKTFIFDDLNSNYSSNLTINSSKDTIAFLRTDVFKMSIEEKDLPIDAFVNSNGRTFYGLGIDNQSRLWVSDAVDFIQKGVVSIYSPKGRLKYEFRAGVIPSRFYFR